MYHSLYLAIQHLVRAILDAPMYHLLLEGVLLLWIIWLMRRKKTSEKPKLTKGEENEIIAAWKPQPLIDTDLSLHESHRSATWGAVEGRPGKYVTIEGKSYLNLASHNYLGFVDDTEFDAEAERCIRQYGVGSCGPRGFYGTVDVHLDLEKEVSKFMNLEETALYSYGFSAIASAIPSYAKSGDVIFVDEFCHFAIQKGLQASKSSIHYFKHNDPKDLERLLDEQLVKDKKNPKKAALRRRFCIVEGIYEKTGQLCPLKEVNKLCKAHKVRLFLDETISFAALGDTGRGITQYLGVDPTDLDFICGSMETGLGAFGGFIAGSEFVVDHQRISGLGYCFSASLPPFLAGVGIMALKRIDQNPHIVRELQERCHEMHKFLEKIKYFNLNGHELSPLKFLSVAERGFPDRKSEQVFLDHIIEYVKDNYDIALIQPSYLEDQEHKLTTPCIRIAVNRLLTSEEMKTVVVALEEAYGFFRPSQTPAQESNRMADTLINGFGFNDHVQQRKTVKFAPSTSSA